MTLRRPDDPLESLVGAMLEGTLSPQQRQELAQLLRADPSARARYIDLVLVHSLLRRELGGVHQLSGEPTGLAQADLEQPITVAARPAPLRIAPDWWRMSGIAVAATILLAIFILPFAWRKSPQPGGPVASVIETLRASGVAPGAAGLSAGSPLPPGVVELAGGHLSLRFGSGAVAYLDGRVKMELVSPNELKVFSGRVVVHVPPAARGFVVRTAEMTAIDLGTELGVMAQAGRSEVHVFEGTVETRDLGGRPLTIDAGRAVRATASGLATMPADSGIFAEILTHPEAGILDTFVCAGTSSDQVFSDDRRLAVKEDSPERRRYSYLQFDLTRIHHPVRSARLIMKVNEMYEGAPGGPEGTVTHQALLVDKGDWTIDRLTWNTQPNASGVVAQWQPRRGQTVEIDLTEPAKAAQRADGRFAIRIAAVGQKGAPVWVDYFSTQGPVADRPRLVLDVGTGQ